MTGDGATPERRDPSAERSADERRRPHRYRAPMWRQAAEGIGLVVALSAAVAAIGLILAIVVAALF